MQKFCIADGEVFANYGPLTIAEHALNLLDNGGLSPDEAMDAIFDSQSRRIALEEEPIAAGKSWEETELQLAQTFQVDPDCCDEDLHFSLADAWGISPERLEGMELGKGAGIVGKLPPAMICKSVITKEKCQPNYQGTLSQHYNNPTVWFQSIGKYF